MWTKEERYRPYQDWPAERKQELKERLATSIWRLNYHVQPETGLLNDPNGFSFFNGKWHLFYQAFPFGAVHGLKSWYQLSSSDLIHWEAEGIALEADTKYDSHGVYSGSAIAVADKLFLAYTGNVRDSEWQRHSYQLGAWLDQKGHVEKISEPLLTNPPKEITAHFRDPQIIQDGENYLMVIGAQTVEKKGEILVFESQDLRQWQSLGALDLAQDLGYMIECPNLLTVNHHALLLFCPQGLDQKVLEYKNIYPNTYILADSYLKSENRLENSSGLHLLDEGFDLYATQAFKAPDGRCLSIGWIGLPEMNYPTFAEDWAHSLSLVKELKIKDNKLLQYPVVETQQLRKTTEHFKLSANQDWMKETQNSYELQVEIPADCQGSIALFADSHQQQALLLSYDTHKGFLKLDRSQTSYPLNQDFGEVRETNLIAGMPLRLNIFIDSSTCEIFINKGEKTMTANYYPILAQNKLILQQSKNINVNYHMLAL